MFAFFTLKEDIVTYFRLGCGHSCGRRCSDSLSCKISSYRSLEELKEKDFLSPNPLDHAEGKDPVSVGRIRADLWEDDRVNLWIVADNLRKGAALNSLQIMEKILEK